MAGLDFTMCLLGIYRIQPLKRRRPPSAINFAWEALMSKFYFFFFLLYFHLGILWLTANTSNISRVLLNIIQLSCPILMFPVSSLVHPFPRAEPLIWSDLSGRTEWKPFPFIIDNSLFLVPFFLPCKLSLIAFLASLCCRHVTEPS